MGQFKTHCKRGHILPATRRCLECRAINWRAWYINNPEKAKRNSKKWRDNNRDLIRKRYRAYVLANPQYFKDIKNKTARSPHGRFLQGLNKAKQRNLEWSITEQEFVTIIARDCFYCGGALPVKGHGLDRVDNNIGYTLANIVPCCRRCNVMKNDMEQGDFLRQITKIYVRRLTNGLYAYPEPLQRA